MTIQIEEKKKKKKQLDVDQLIERRLEQTRKQLMEHDQSYFKRKTEIIHKTADDLSKIEGIELQKISTIIAKRLKVKGISQRWIMATLPPEYKSEAHRKSVSHRKDRSINATKQALPSLETEEPEVEAEDETWQIDPKDYEVEDLPKYDKNMLIKIIMMYRKDDELIRSTSLQYDKRMSTQQKRIAELEKENSELEAKLAKLAKWDYT